jgi:hypothetical protein
VRINSDRWDEWGMKQKLGQTWSASFFITSYEITILDKQSHSVRVQDLAQGNINQPSAIKRIENL